jgi:hypothetical protein
VVTHAYNPSYSGGRDQKECGSKPAFTKISLVEWLKVKALSSSPRTANKQTNPKEKGLGAWLKWWFKRL